MRLEECIQYHHSRCPAKFLPKALETLRQTDEVPSGNLKADHRTNEGALETLRQTDEVPSGNLKADHRTNEGAHKKYIRRIICKLNN